MREGNPSATLLWIVAAILLWTAAIVVLVWVL